jgi:2-polyprenyl-6-methoxyphenol hydroxylase-like FAD-dependent oxidoreductase
MKILVSGVGIAGPALAYWLRRFGHEPTLLERAPEFRDGGYVIDFWGTGYDVAERMGILPTLLERGYQVERLEMVDERGSEVAAVSVEPLRASTGNRFTSVARTDVSAALLGACQGVPVHFGTTITRLEQDEAGVAVELSGGRSERFDLVVGADGLHSGVRALAFGAEHCRQRELGCHVAAVRLAGYPHRKELAYVSHTVPKRQVARLALRNGESLLLFICRSELFGADDPSKDVKAALRHAFGSMGWEVPEMLAAIEHAEDLYFDRVSQILLEHWCKGRVALVGDAAACVSFLAGEGTGLAIVEAYVLAGELHRAGKDWAHGLRQYEARLRAFVRKKQDAALRLRGFFAPRTALGLGTRNALVNALSLPFLAKPLLSRALRDDLVLPDYEEASR